MVSVLVMDGVAIRKMLVKLVEYGEKTKKEVLELDVNMLAEI